MMATRTRILIGAVAVIALGVLVFVLSQPRKGSVEWHKREYARAARRVTVGPWVQWVGWVYETASKRQAPWLSQGTAAEAYIRLHTNHIALLRMGYVRHHRFALVYREAGQLRTTVEAAFGGEKKALRRGVWVSDKVAGVLIVEAPRGMLPRIEELVRKADVPESVKAE
jgi:hypothetical protein